MNKKIKIIEIFNIISNGDYKALPLNIEVDGKKYKWDTLERFYSRENGDREDLLQLSIVHDTVTFLDINAKILDNIEDNTKEIEELEYEENKMYCDTQLIESIKTAKQEDIIDKINELVRVVNELRRDKNNE